MVRIFQNYKTASMNRNCAAFCSFGAYFQQGFVNLKVSPHLLGMCYISLKRSDLDHIVNFLDIMIFWFYKLLNLLELHTKIFTDKMIVSGI